MYKFFLKQCQVFLQLEVSQVALQFLVSQFANERGVFYWLGFEDIKGEVLSKP